MGRERGIVKGGVPPPHVMRRGVWVSSPGKTA